MLVVAAVLFQGAPAHADKKKDLRKAAEAAEKRGDIEGAETAYCALSTEDKKSESARAKCAAYTQKANELRKADSDHLAAGKAALAAGRFDEASRHFKAVVTTQRRNEATHALTVLLPEAQKRADEEHQRREQQRKEREDSARDLKQYNDGLEAYRKNDFNRARQLLAEVTGEHRAQAAQTVRNIDDYSRLFDQGFKLERAGKQKRAVEAYTAALKIKADGPWEINARVARLQEILNKQEVSPPISASQDSGNDEALIGAIDAFYKADYQQAEQKLQNYNGSPNRKALALFYLGAAKLSRYFLAGGSESERPLYNEAVDNFRAARQAGASFKPPDRYISPRILKIFNELQ